MYFAGSLFFAFAITLFLVSKIAKMLNAKRPDIGWIFFALIAGSILAFVTIIALGMFVEGQDPNVMLGITLASAFIVSSAAYRYINKLNWSGAITLNIASIAVGVLTMVTAVVLNGESLSETIDTINITAKKNTSIVKSMTTDNLVHEGIQISDSTDATDASMSEEALNTDITDTNNVENEIATEDEEEPVFREIDLLPAGAVRDIKKRQKRVYVEPKFRVVSLGNIHSAVGHRIRIYRENGNMVIGALKRVDGNDAVISRYTSKGTVIMPISIAKIHKLEVYK